MSGKNVEWTSSSRMDSQCTLGSWNFGFVSQKFWQASGNNFEKHYVPTFASFSTWGSPPWHPDFPSEPPKRRPEWLLSKALLTSTCQSNSNRSNRFEVKTGEKDWRRAPKPQAAQANVASRWQENVAVNCLCPNQLNQNNLMMLWFVVACSGLFWFVLVCACIRHLNNIISSTCASAVSWVG